LMLAPKRLPSCICSSRLDWNFDNMELSALACEAVNCCVQRDRRGTIDWVRKKSPSHTTTMREVREIFRCRIKLSRIPGFHALPLRAVEVAVAAPALNRESMTIQTDLCKSVIYGVHGYCLHSISSGSKRFAIVRQGYRFLCAQLRIIYSQVASACGYHDGARKVPVCAPTESHDSRFYCVSLMVLTRLCNLFVSR
jgi:hypothetical protein